MSLDAFITGSLVGSSRTRKPEGPIASLCLEDVVAAFLSAVAGRFGLWTGQVRLDAFESFIARTAELNAWAPRFMIPVLAWSATVAETTLAVTLIAGIGVRWAAFGSAALPAWSSSAARSLPFPRLLLVWRYAGGQGVCGIAAASIRTVKL